MRSMESPKAPREGRTGSPLSPAQEEMRQNILGRTTPKHPQCDPTKLGDVLDEELGEQRDDDVSRMAHLLIEEHGQGLFLDIGGWSLVQRIVEAAVRVDPQDL